MIIKKSVNVLQGTATAEKRWGTYHPVIFSGVNEDELIISGKSKGLLKLVISVVYFLSLVSALTILLT